MPSKDATGKKKGEVAKGEVAAVIEHHSHLGAALIGTRTKAEHKPKPVIATVLRRDLVTGVLEQLTGEQLSTSTEDSSHLIARLEMEVNRQAQELVELRFKHARVVENLHQALKFLEGH